MEYEMDVTCFDTKSIIVPKNNSYDCTEKNDSMIYSKNISPLAGMFDVKWSIETE